MPKLIYVATALLALFAGTTAGAATALSSHSLYVPMPDGTPIAVTIHLPSDMKLGERLPVLMRTTRYWREFQPGPLLRPMIRVHLMSPTVLVDSQVKYFVRRRFAVLLVDARGSGASGGCRVVEYSNQEIADMGDVAAWAAKQPWSNGRVGTFGISYEGNTAELAAVPNQPAIQVLMPLFGTYDNLENLSMDGVGFKSFLAQWSDIVRALDHNDVCGAAEVTGIRCWANRLWIGGVLPVSDDPKGLQRASMQRQHDNWNVAEAIKHIEFRDDPIPTKDGSVTSIDWSPYSMRTPIEASGVPMMVWTSWYDGNVEGHLIRYQTVSNPQVLIIGALSHGGDHLVDPFTSRHNPPIPSEPEQFREQADFFDTTLRGEPSRIKSFIRYYTVGSGQWHTSDVWPPAGFTPLRLYFGELHHLSEEPPATTAGEDSYAVDFTATAGERTRWHTGLGGGDVVYPDRASEDRKLLVYTSDPLPSDIEITGMPMITLEMATSTADGAIHAYLEDVAPNGRVTYVNEGDLRLIDRREVERASIPYPTLGPAHSLLRRDSDPMEPGVPATLHVEMYPISVLLRKSHRIRISLAGADAGFFERYPAHGTSSWTIFRNADRASSIELPVSSAGTIWLSK